MCKDFFIEPFSLKDQSFCIYRLGKVLKLNLSRQFLNIHRYDLLENKEAVFYWQFYTFIQEF